jgi:hypothetical protein
MTPTETRLQIFDNGFMPVVVNGKAAVMNNWTKKFETNAAEIELWGSLFENANNTGILAKFTPALDIDITDPDAAKAIEALAHEHFEERGDILVRIGLQPKRLIPLRTDEPFTKMGCALVAPDGKEHGIEILGDGQQWVARGIHPDTRAEYEWRGGDPTTTKREDLPHVRRDDMRKFLDDAVQLLVEKFNYVLTDATADDGEPHKPGEPQAAPDKIAFALAVIPNNRDWHGWNNIGMATWRATGSSEVGFAAFDAWSRKSSKYDPDNTRERWNHYFKSPPKSLGKGTIFYHATLASPHWELDYQAKVNPAPPEPSPWEPPKPEPGPGPEPEPGPPPPEPEPTPAQLPYIDLIAPLTDRQWLVADRVPMFNVTSLSGEGAVGKSILLLQLSVACVLGREWIGTFPETGPVLYAAAEDDADEIRRRLEAIANHYGTTRQAMLDAGLHILSFAGRDAILGAPDRHGIIRSTVLFDRIMADAVRSSPS